MIEKMPESGGKTKPVDKPVDNVHKSAKTKKQKPAKTAPKTSRKPKKRGNKPGNNGRTGYRAPHTLERLVAKRQMIARISEATDSLLNAALNKARGEQYLICRRETGKGKTRKVTVETVTDMDTIKKYFIDDGITLNQNDSEDSEYYYISTKPADGNVIRDLFDRAYGRSTEKVELGGKDEGDLAELSDEDLNGKINQYLRRRGTAKTSG